MDEWTERLSEYVDGELDDGTRSELERHITGCDECRAIIADLRFVVASAAALEDADPPVDLWNGIAAQIGATTHGASQAARIIPIDAHRKSHRSFTLSIPQLAAAATVLLVLGGAAVYTLRPDSNTQIAANNGVAPDDAAGTYAATTPDATPIDVMEPTGSYSAGDVRAASQPLGAPSSLAPVGGYDVAIAELEQAAAQSRGQLDPTTLRVIEQTMGTIDQAIADARAALAAEPSNAYLHRHLDRTMKQKLDLLRRSAKIDRGGA
ncbi:MAG: zf-HC2 domain-containing protein [Longimicrobiales bacterium]